MNLRLLSKPFKSLGNERRLEIMLLLLKNKPYNVSDLAYKLQVTFRGISKHLQILENSNLVVRSRTGKHIYYRANVGNKDFKKLFDYLKSIN